MNDEVIAYEQYAMRHYYPQKHGTWLKYGTELQFACAADDFRMAIWLLDRGVDVTRAPINDTYHYEINKILYDYGAVVPLHFGGRLRMNVEIMLSVVGLPRGVALRVVWWMVRTH